MQLKRWRGWLLVLVAAAGVLLGVREIVRRSVRIAYMYEMEADFASLPVDDNALCRRLVSHPGVLPRNAVICRVGADQKTVRVMFMQIRNLAGQPPLPDLAGQCAALGYTGPACAFRVSTDPVCHGGTRCCDSSDQH